MPVISLQRKSCLPAPVDLVDDHIDPRQHLLEVRDTPFFKSLRQHGVVSERHGLSGYIPGVRPFETLFIDEHSHEFRDAHGRVRIVDVDLNPVRQFFPLVLSVARLVLVYDHTDTGRDQEVLLSQTELLAYTVGVVRIENACDGLYLTAFLHGLAVVAGVEGFHVDGIVHRLGIPEVEGIDGLSAESDDRNVIRHRPDGGVVDVLIFHDSVFERSFDLTAESDHYRVIRLGMLPDIAFIQPRVRKLYLVAALYPLLEESELVPQTHAVALDAQRGH